MGNSPSRKGVPTDLESDPESDLNPESGPKGAAASKHSETTKPSKKRTFDDAVDSGTPEPRKPSKKTSSTKSRKSTKRTSERTLSKSTRAAVAAAVDLASAAVQTALMEARLTLTRVADAVRHAGIDDFSRGTDAIVSEHRAAHEHLRASMDKVYKAQEQIVRAPASLELQEDVIRVVDAWGKAALAAMLWAVTAAMISVVYVARVTNTGIAVGNEALWEAAAVASPSTALLLSPEDARQFTQAAQQSLQIAKEALLTLQTKPAEMLVQAAAQAVALAAQAAAGAANMSNSGDGRLLAAGAAHSAAAPI